MNDATTITQLTEQPSKTLDEAIDRLSATALQRIDEVVKERDMAKSGEQAAHNLLTKALAKVDELTRQRDAEGVSVIRLTRQRDELAACLRDVLKGFETGVFVRNIEGDGQPDWAVKMLPFITLLGRSQAALLRLDVRDRLGDKLQAERKETA